MQRLRLYDMILSRLPQTIGLTKGNVPAIAQAVNESQEMLLYAKEAGEEGWGGGWSEMVFSVDRRHPYITTPRGVARIEALDVCSHTVPLRNQFYEYMLFGNGRMPNEGRWPGKRWGQVQGFTRNYSPTFVDIDHPPQQIQIFAVNPADAVPNAQTGAVPRVLLQGLDQNGSIITSMDGNNLVQGEFVKLQSPYSLSVNTYSCLTGIQKDVTQGEVQIFQSDPYWGMSEILLTMEPGETTGWYRRYYLNGLPGRCCPSFRPIPVNAQPPKCGCPYERREHVQVTAIAKLDLIPVVYPTDYCLLQSSEAIIAGCQSIRMSKMDDAESKAQAKVYGDQAVSLLRGQVRHTEGKNTVSVNFRPFGSASLQRYKIGGMK